MEQAGIEPIINLQSNATIVAAKVVSRLRLAGNVFRSSSKPVFVSFMGFSESKVLPFAYWNEIVPYCFDCWPNMYERWESFFKRHLVRIALFSARQSAQYFSQKLPDMRSVWIPEAADPCDYNPVRPLMERDIDVLELGRKNDLFHARIVKPLSGIGKIHLFERIKGEIVFRDRLGLIDGLGRSKISICFPCSQTHPQRAGTVETVTLRYFESIASKCLIVGHAPQELVDLFGYNPVVEVQTGYEFEQICSLLNNLASMEGLVDRNYRRLLEVGTWNVRVSTILNILREFLS